MKNIIPDKASKKIKLISLSSLLTGLAMVSTTLFAYNDTVLASSLTVTPAGHDHASENKADDHGQKTKVDDGPGHSNENGSASEEDHDEGISFSPEKMALANI